MIVTDIRKTKRGRFSVYINDEFSGVLHGDIYFTSGVKIGEEITSDDLVELIYESQTIIAKERALGLLSARSYTRKGLIDKLLRDVETPAANQVADRMEELGLLDDRDYARRYSADCINLRGFSHSRTASALAQRGISREIIKETLDDLGEEPSEELILKLINKKYLGKISDEGDARRTTAALMRRGFRYDDIKRVIDNLTSDPDYYNY